MLVALARRAAEGATMNSEALPGVAAETPALVAVVTSAADLARATEECWYRIPVASAPRPLAAHYLALYETARCILPGRQVRIVAPILGWRRALRRELLPEQPAHPRADQLYYRLELGPATALERPIPGERLARITFIPTTVGRLRRAVTARQLWPGREALAELCAELRAEGFAMADRRLREEPF